MDFISFFWALDFRQKAVSINGRTLEIVSTREQIGQVRQCGTGVDPTVMTLVLGVFSFVDL